MRIGYPCINNSVGCTANRTFRLRNYSDERFVNTVAFNLACLKKIFEFNKAHGILFFRISSDLIPFASHPACAVDWQTVFSNELVSLGRYVRKNNMRISMHPDQFVILNAQKSEIITSSIAELRYHAQVLGAMKLPVSAKIQIHIGGVYGDKQAAVKRFVKTYAELDDTVKSRLVIENDDNRYSLADCIHIHEVCGVPILLDVFHHELLGNEEGMDEVLKATGVTWKKKDGLPMIDYSSQRPNARKGAHVESLNGKRFKAFLKISKKYDFDCMLEIKDKEKSALKALSIIAGDERLIINH
jgi:UV DNA damage endonuclease